MNANNTQVGGSHYKADYQHWDFVRLCLGGRYLEGNFTKYVARHRKKNGLQDLRKARHYLDKIIELFIGMEYECCPLNLDTIPEDRWPAAFAKANELTIAETALIIGISHWSNVQVLYSMRDTLDVMIIDAERAEQRQQAIKAGALSRQPSGEEPGRGYVNPDG